MRNSVERKQVSNRPLRIGLYGCPPGTGNRGVDALRISMTEGLLKSGVDVQVNVFGYGSGVRDVHTEMGSSIRLVGAFPSRRLYSTSNLQQMYLASRLGIWRAHPTLSYIRGLDILCDITGGDSFTDLYGKRRFRYGTMFKEFAIANDLPLILLPQTYGPFWHETGIARVKNILRSSTQVWARDGNSLELAQSLVGREFGTNHIRQTVDVAFGLPSRRPSDGALVDQLLRLRGDSNSVVGVNVSGLVYNIPGYAESHFGLRADYNKLIDRLLAELLSEKSTRIVLIPHVGPEGGSTHDNDALACQEIVSKLSRSERERVLLLPSQLDATEMKWVIGQLDWLCATRMHAAIAGISQGIATAAIAYSDKTLGVFKTASAESSVFDPRSESEDEIFQSILEHYSERQKHSATLRSGTKEHVEMLSEFFRTLVT